MKTFVVFLELKNTCLIETPNCKKHLHSSIQNPEMFKCISTSVAEKDIIHLHEHIYPNRHFILKNRVPIYDNILFNSFLAQIPQYKTSFVTVSFDATCEKYESNFYSVEQYSTILKVIEHINALCAIVGTFTKYFTTNNDNNENVIIPCKNTIDIIDTGNTGLGVVIMNNGFTYNIVLLRLLFPELVLHLYSNFPTHELALDMLHYLLSLQYSTKDAVDKVVSFFSTTVDSPFFSIKDLELSLSACKVNVDHDKFDVIKQFISSCCKTVPNSSIQSSEVYEYFKKWCIQHNFPVFSSTTFGTYFKQLGLWEDTRKCSGIFYKNLELNSS